MATNKSEYSATIEEKNLMLANFNLTVSQLKHDHNR